MFSHIQITPHEMFAAGSTDELVALNKHIASMVGKASKIATDEYTPLLLVGPSGAGKGSILEHLTAAYPDKFGFSVSYTTRAPREKEENGVHYNFVTKKEFEQMIDADQFIEWCNVHNNMYGTAKTQIAKT